MKINKDLIIEDSNYALKDIPERLPIIDKLSSRIRIWSGSRTTGQTVTLDNSYTWESLGKFKNLILIYQFSATNTTTSVYLAYEQICNATSINLNDNKRVTNSQAHFTIDGSQKNINFIPASAISSNTIKLDWGDVGVLTAMYIDY